MILMLDTHSWFQRLTFLLHSLLNRGEILWVKRVIDAAALGSSCS